MDILFVPDAGSRHLHVVHPNPARWNDLFKALASSLSRHQEPGIGLVPYKAWFAALEARQNEPGAVERIPALRLLDFFRNAVPATTSASPSSSPEAAAAAAAAVVQPLNAADREAMGMARMETEKSQSISASLWNARTLDEGDALKWVEYWGNHGLF